MDKAALKEALREMIRDGEIGLTISITEEYRDFFEVKVALTIDNSEVEDEFGRVKWASDKFSVDIDRGFND